MAQAVERVNSPDDPRRCQGNPHGNQCWNVAADESRFCPSCAAKAGEMVEAKAVQQYRLTDPRYQARLVELSEDDGLLSLRQEVALAKMLLEDCINRALTSDQAQDWYTATAKAHAFMLTIEKLSSRTHILEQNLGQLLHKSTVIQMVQAFVAIVDEEVSGLPGGVEAKDKIVERLFKTAQQARNEEKARGIKLLTTDE